MALLVDPARVDWDDYLVHELLAQMYRTRIPTIFPCDSTGVVGQSAFVQNDEAARWIRKPNSSIRGSQGEVEPMTHALAFIAGQAALNSDFHIPTIFISQLSLIDKTGGHRQHYLLTVPG